MSSKIIPTESLLEKLVKTIKKPGLIEMSKDVYDVYCKSRNSAPMDVLITIHGPLPITVVKGDNILRAKEVKK